MSNLNKDKSPLRNRREFIRTTGMVIGSAVFSGANAAPSDGCRDLISEPEDNKIGEGFFDIHLHTCFPRLQNITRPNGSHYPSPAVLIEMMDNAGIAKAVVLSTLSPECRYTIVTPEETLQICNKYPGRLVPFCNFDPRYLTNNTKANFLPLLTAYKEAGFKGVGEYIPNIYLDDPLNMNFFGQVEEAGLPLTFHLAPQTGGYYGCVDDPGLPRLEKVLKSFPKLIFLGHSQVFWSEIGILKNPDERKGYPRGPIGREGRVVELMRKYPNLHGDLSAGSGFNAVSRDPEFGYRFMEEFQYRLYFGTDIANVPQDLPIVPYFKKLKEEKLISASAYKKIAWKNAENLLMQG